MLHSSLTSNLEFSVRYAVLAALVSLICWILADRVFPGEATTLAATALLTTLALFVLLSYL
jgi:phosphate starvation-inducible membrane PsiE